MNANRNRVLPHGARVRDDRGVVDERIAPDVEPSDDMPSGDMPSRTGGRATRLFRAAWSFASGLVARVLHADRVSWLRVVVFALAGATLAVLLFGRVAAKVGPFETTMSVRPSFSGNTIVQLAPLGSVRLDTHDWPVTFTMRVDQLGVADAEAIADNPARLERLGDDAADQVRSAIISLAVRCAIVGLLGGVVGALAARVSWRTALGGAGVGALLVVSLGAGSWVTFRSEAVAEPRYTGLLTRAPTAVGNLETVLDRFGEYREQLSDLVDNMATLYLAGAELPTFQPESDDLIRVLHVSDIHLNPQAFDMIDRLVDQFGVDVVADTGDITDWGSGPEAQFVSQVGRIDVPYVYVRGNHDSLATQAAVAAQDNSVVLDGGAENIAGLRFWGIGDPRFTPDKSEEVEGTEQERALALAPEVVDGVEEDQPPAIDVVMVHDERMAADLGGVVPLVLAGHTHEPTDTIIEPPDPEEDEDADTSDGEDADEDADDQDAGDEDADTTGGDGANEDADGTATTDGDDEPEIETRLLVEGSTGGAGLRGLQGDDPEPLTATILYFDPDESALVAYDRLSVAWLEDAGATIQRHIVADRPGPDDEPTDTDTDGTGGTEDAAVGRDRLRREDVGEGEREAGELR
jgi:predicted phosphodiesterase